MKKYRLKDEKYRKLSQTITGFVEGGSLPLEYFVSMEGSSMRDKLIEYGVFDLWFEEVQEYKSGDYISVLYSSEVYEIEDCEVKRNKLHWNTVGVDRMGYEYRFSAPLGNIRHATAEEIEKYKQRLPLIDGFEGKQEGDFIVYGCQRIHIIDFRKLYVGCLHTNVTSITIAGHQVPMETLKEIYEKTY
jgi:hypothetical protein